MNAGRGGARRRPVARLPASSVGFSLIELLLVAAILSTMSVVAVTGWKRMSDRMRAVGAVRTITTVLQRARGLAVAGGANVAVRFVATTAGVQASTYVDANGNGVTSADVAAGIDRPAAPTSTLTEFGDAGFGLWPGLLSPDGEPLTGDDPIRVGGARMVSFTPYGTCSPGSLYIKGAGAQQYVIRVFGDTGRTRVLRYAWRTREWVPL